ncbi:MAG: hypothetical protein HGA16_01670 [Candidatus Moranbacteria bacterium]|nr:hypothetical protein [Candidatus Moranbacteria bacterium]
MTESPSKYLSAFQLYQAVLNAAKEKIDYDPENSTYDSAPKSEMRRIVLLIPLSEGSSLQLLFCVGNDLKTAFFQIETPPFTEKNFLPKIYFDVGGRPNEAYEDQSAYGIVRNFFYDTLMTYQKSFGIHLNAKDPEWNDAEKYWIYNIKLTSPRSCTQEIFNESLDATFALVNTLAIIWKNAIEKFSEFQKNRKQQANAFIVSIKEAIKPYLES